MLQVSSTQRWTVRDRLITAADEELGEHSSLTGRFDAVARRAGVSRATAYRHLGSVAELLTQVRIRRSQKHIAAMYEVMSRETTAMDKLAAAMVYGARELPNEPIVLDLIARNTGTIVDPEVHQLVVDLTGSLIEQGQRSGEIRTDIGRDYIFK